ncbi:MAG: methionyl-tRNA formyltransferase [Marinilabiliales bacterium]
MENKDFRIVFMGTAEFAVESLKILYENSFDIVAVVTAPDKPAGRGQKLSSSPVKKFAFEKNLKIFQPKNLKDEKFIYELKELNAHLFVVVAFRMLPEVVWNMPPFGTINLHASLLPHYRGAAPINRAIMNGEKYSGVTTFFINDKIDSGNILLQQKVEITEDMDAGRLHDVLMHKGAKLLIDTVCGLKDKKLQEIPQSKLLPKDEPIKTAPKIFKEDCKINWEDDVADIYNFIRGLSPYPGAWTIINKNDKKYVLKILKSEIIYGDHDLIPGKIVSDNKTYFYISADDGLINVLSLQLEGKKRLDTPEFLRGFSLDNVKIEIN